MLVLVGPQGAGKKGLAQKLVEEFPDYFGEGISHTTRKPHADEVQDKDYHFCTLEEFEEHIKMVRVQIDLLMCYYLQVLLLAKRT